jgi:hypothetical protein
MQCVSQCYTQRTPRHARARGVCAVLCCAVVCAWHAMPCTCITCTHAVCACAGCAIMCGGCGARTAPASEVCGPGTRSPHVCVCVVAPRCDEITHHGRTACCVGMMLSHFSLAAVCHNPAVLAGCTVVLAVAAAAAFMVVSQLTEQSSSSSSRLPAQLSGWFGFRTHARARAPLGVVVSVWYAGWLAGWLACWLAGWLACWLAGCVRCTCRTVIGCPQAQWRARNLRRCHSAPHPMRSSACNVMQSNRHQTPKTRGCAFKHSTASCSTGSSAHIVARRRRPIWMHGCARAWFCRVW